MLSNTAKKLDQNLNANISRDVDSYKISSAVNKPRISSLVEDEGGCC